ncbi:MAG: class C sortase [Lachnospiraceae bacterium]
MKYKTMKRMKRRPRISTIFLILLLLIGLSVLLYPTANDIYYRWKAGREIAQYNQVSEPTKKDYSEFWDAAEEYNRQLALSNQFAVSVATSDADYISQFLNPLGTGMMGYIDIEKIGVHLPIYQGTDESALQAGAGFWLGTSLPTGGESTHCVITAHNGLVRAKMFTELDQLEEGDKFSLSILDRVLTYEVDQIMITEPDDLEPLQIVKGRDYVTLYTCYPYGINTQRLLVRGCREETPEEKILEYENTEETMEQVPKAAFVGVGLAAILIIFVLVKMRKRK